MQLTRLVFALALGLSMIQTQFALAGDKEDIEAAVAEWAKAANAGDAAGIAALYTDDAVLLPPGAPIAQGKDKIQGLWKSMLDMGVSNIQLNPTEIIVSGNDASEVGTFSYTAGDTKGTGKYIVLWRKGDDGKWRLRRDIWNDDSTPE
jgi:uncharacterized protein (TIGR02246 family)